MLERMNLALAGMAAYLARAFGPTTLGVLHYGSRAQGRASRADSPFDFFVVVESYRAAYRCLAAQPDIRHRTRLARLFAHVLPPNAIAITIRIDSKSYQAKCIIISARHLQRECSTSARDHFVRARMMQHVEVVWSRDPQASVLAAAISGARQTTVDWVRVFLPPSFDVADYCHTLLAVSFCHELRVEPRGHATVVFEAQRASLCENYKNVLGAYAQRGELSQDNGRYELARPTRRFEELRIRWWFRWSLLRTTLRILKHPLLYDDWIGYMLRKIRRHTGESIELTKWERRYPLIFLWPRAVRLLRRRLQPGEPT
jgi:hypothetical protein